MDSPPSSSSWSQVFILSDDSGLLLTTGSASSANSSFESKSDKRHYHFEDSDCEERSLSQDDSFDGMSDVICGENFNTLKKGPHWTELKAPTSPIEPPLEFQDRPASPDFDLFYTRLTKEILEMALSDLHDFWIEKKKIIVYKNKLNKSIHLHLRHCHPERQTTIHLRYLIFLTIVVL